jgi:uncharacterized membrane protein YkoI
LISGGGSFEAATCMEDEMPISSSRAVWALLAVGVCLSLSPVANADWDTKHLKLVRMAPITLKQAVATAEHDLKGRAYSALAVVTDTDVNYTIRLLINDKPVTADVEGRTGKVTASTPAAGESPAMLKEFAKVKTSLLTAIKAAEATAKGKAFQAAFKHDPQKSIFEVDVASRGDSEKDVVLDAATGKIRKVSDKAPELAGLGEAVN